MAVVALRNETDFEGWRTAARSLRSAGTRPREVSWVVGEGDLFVGLPPPSLHPDDRPRGSVLQNGPVPKRRAEEAFSVPAEFPEIARAVVCHRSPDRFAVLYRLLFRLRDEPDLLKIASDPDVARARDMAKAVSRAAHKMKAFLRFREVPDDKGEVFVAWFEPAHRVVERTAPFFVKRFTSLRFSILTPDACAHWDGQALSFTPGADKSQAPDGDALEEFWKTYYASIFNPARLKVDAMQKEMPKRYWRNLPEAALIPGLIETAEQRSTAMVEARPTETRKKTRAAAAPERTIVGPGEDLVPRSLSEIAELIQGCRRCDLWRNATQGVPGEGPARARLMIVGEQPGDQEDLAGKPFIGPAGKVFDRALAEAQVPRSETYVTNAVKHFKNLPRGKRRLHQTPNSAEMKACRWWLEHERALVRPRVILAMGATAAASVMGRPTPIGKSRGQVFQLEDQSQAIITLHPSAILRMPDEAAKQAGYDQLVDDIARAWKHASGR